LDTPFEPFKVVKQQKVSAQVYEQLLEQMKINKWTEGTKLPSENELRKELGVSRISIREAVQKMTALGIVETRQGEGSFVRKVTAENYKDMLFPMFLINKNTLQEILEYRMFMEVGATEVAVDRITQEELEALEIIVKRMEDNESDFEAFSHDDIEFHMAIANATKNNLIINVSLFMQDIMSATMKSIVKNLGLHDGKYYHRLILEELKKRNKEGAVQAMREHVGQTVTRVSNLSSID
jgi:GntR family transcriptional repressor for pyruvate dehydrogenase complex